MLKKLLACFVFLLVMVSSAFGEAELWYSHDSIASITNGHSDYSDAQFGYLYFTVIHNDTPVTKETAKLSGTITLSGGNYSFWNGREIQKVSGTSQTFRLGLETWLTSGDEAAYQPFTAVGGELKCGLEANNGLNGVNMSWNFPDDPSINGTFTLPNFMTTQEQLNNCVLWFEFIRSGEDVTGINWRIVRASDTSTAVPQDFRLRFNRFEVWNFNEEKIYNNRPKAVIEAGDIPEGVYMFDNPIKESEIWRIRIRLNVYDEEVEENYAWYFYVPTSTNVYLFNRHASDASLVNGKSDYSNAKFSNLFFEVDDEGNFYCEPKYLTDTGRITVPGGGYTLTDIDNNETLRSIDGDMTFMLKNDSEAAIGHEYITYQPVDENGRYIAFGGVAETGLNGKIITWTLPEEFNMNGSGMIPNYKTTAEQLASGVPYIEVVSEDGYITAINYKIVTSSNLSASITPSYRTDFRFYFDRATGRDVWANTYREGWQRNTSSGIYTLGIPQPVNIIERIRVRLRTYEDSSNPCVYQWNFYPASDDPEPEPEPDPEPDPTPRAPSSSGGGCSAGFTLAGLALIAMLIRKH